MYYMNYYLYLHLPDILNCGQDYLCRVYGRASETQEKAVIVRHVVYHLRYFPKVLVAVIHRYQKFGVVIYNMPYRPHKGLLTP